MAVQISGNDITVPRDTTVTRNLTVGGVLTYEDVTNVDSIGIVTARAGVLVGSGITLSKDGDIFATGVCTATSFSGSGANLTGIDTDLVSDTSPQLGGNLDVNTKNIVFGDSGGATDDRLTFGASTDLSIYHDGSHSRIDETGTGNLMIQSDNAVFIKKGTAENIAIFNADGAVELYHDNVKRFETDSNGARIVAPEGEQAILRLLGDEADDANDSFRLNAGGGTLKIQDASNQSSWEDNIVINAAGSVDLYYDNTKRFSTTSTGVNVIGNFGVGDTSADFELEVHGDSPQLRLEEDSTGGSKRLDLEVTSSGQAIISANQSSQTIQFQTASTLRVEIQNNGRLVAPQVYSTAGSSMRDVQIESDGTFAALSSITKAKTNITDLTDVSWLYNLKPKTFNFRKKTSNPETGVNTYLDEAETEKAYGLLAEDVETVNKDFCFYDKDSEGNDVLAGVYYKTLVVPLLKAVQELSAENTALKSRLDAAGL